MRLEKDGTRTVLANGFEGKHFNGPNDVAIAADGAIYFTDSDVGLRGGIHSPLVQMPDSVRRWKDGKVRLVVSREQLGAEPNGIALSPDDKYLYLSAGTGSPDPKLMRYPVHADGRQGIVRITSPQGKPLGLLNLPTQGDAEPRKTLCASALAFGGDDAKTLYITTCEYIYAIQLRAQGILEGPEQ